MIRSRMFGSDIEFMAWIRRQTDRLPSCDIQCGIAVTDVDFIVHRYLTDLRDAEGSRAIQGMMMVEVKTRGGKPSKSQLDTLYKQNLFQGIRISDKQYIRHFGVSVLQMDGTTPDNSKRLRWGRFEPDKGRPRNINFRDISLEQLFELLRFEIHPNTLQKRWFRRHHKTRQIQILERTPLGFWVEREIRIRS